MSSQLRDKIISAVQNDIPISVRPFAYIADECSCTEDEVVETLQKLQKNKYIKRFAFFLNYRALGKVSVLAAAKVPEDRIDECSAHVNKLQCVSHNYLRSHPLNMWFTVTADSKQEIEFILSSLANKTSLTFQIFPALHFYKLNVRFNNVRYQPRTLPSAKVRLSERDKLIIKLLQPRLNISARPFRVLQNAHFSESDIVDTARYLHEKGVIKKLTVLMNHYKLGFRDNVMFAARTDIEDHSGGEYLASFSNVSHCCIRRPAKDFPYNLFAMIHGRSEEDIAEVTGSFLNRYRVDHCFLRTVQELKKEPVKITLD